ncbi:AraC family transcriptional regulator [Marinifilum sp. D737]|uniref:AraC family transcriptional regulator n=1 Tax=Marinifilum sp. D737 TaxID=2969628 RepID=UPI0022750BCF|nr:AraC family transcriptional regulator [Marinifilum sp. D737]MCY1635460.1 helix-turn-helix transcriptional regulator [Marinifilum sp. D737]
MKEEYKKLIKTYQKKIMVDRISQGQYDTTSPHSTTLHRHNYFQIVWITQGNGTHLVEQEKYNYEAGSLFLLASHFMHQIEYNQGVEGFVISFSDTFLDTHQYQSTLLFYNSQECLIQIPSNEQELLNTEIAHLHYYFCKSDFTDQNIILQNYLHIILTKIAAFKLQQQNQNSTTNASHLKLLEQFVLLVRDHFKEQKNLRFYQDHLNVSQRKLNDIITERTGIPPAKFIEQYTLNEAARMISFSTYSIKEIAGMLGYMDNSYFTKAFKKHFNKTPIQYREESLDL